MPYQGGNTKNTYGSECTFILHTGRHHKKDLREQMALIETKKPKSWVIHPYSKFRFRWDIATVGVILLNVVTIPLEFSIFDGSTALDGLKAFTDIWFIIDIMLNFSTGILTNYGRGNVNMDPADIRRAYLKSWFILDLLATIPFDIFCQNLFGSNISRRLK